MLSRLGRAVHLATAIVTIVTIPWPLVCDELDRAPLASQVEPLSLAPTDAIGEAPFPTFSADTVDISGVGPGSHTVDLAAASTSPPSMATRRSST